MIDVKNITKRYSENSGNFSISLSLNNGEILGIMGANGAGKSTLLRQILGFVKPDVGEVLIDGKNSFLDFENIMKFSGYIPGELSLYEGLTGKKYLKIASSLKGDVDWSFVERLIIFFNLDVNKKIKKMSSGMKQKVAIITALMHKPKLLILDEPTRGLDAAASEQFKEIILKFKNEFGATVIFCSHIFEEIDYICDKVIFIKNGKVVKNFQVDENSDLTEIRNEFIAMIDTKDLDGVF